MHHSGKTLVSHTEDWGHYEFGGEDIWEISIFCAQFFCELKTALKRKKKLLALKGQ